VADGLPELGATELAEMQIAAEMIKNVSSHKDTQSGKQRFPRLKCHVKAEYGEASPGVKQRSAVWFQEIVIEGVVSGRGSG